MGGEVSNENGYFFSSTVIIYDPENDSWADGPSLPAPRSGCRAVEHAGGIIVVSASPPLRFQDGEWSELLDIAGGPVILTPGSFSAGSVCVY